MKEIRILVTGVGRRVELVQALRQAALNLGIMLRIYGADMISTAPALAYCDYNRQVCSMRDMDYIKQLVDICISDKIDLILPTIDTDLLVLSQNIDAFKNVGTNVLISKPDKILICRDKNFTGDFFMSCGLKAPLTYNNFLDYPGPYPCFIKPKNGSSSINAFKVESIEELTIYANQIEDYIIQPYICGREFTIDIFCDFDGNPIYITPRERLQVRAGEVLKTRIYYDEIMIDEARRLCEVFRPCGPVTVQLIKDQNTGENYYIEINPRFGGGAPLSIKAGASSLEALLLLLIGESLEYQGMAYNDGAIYSRFDQSVCVYKGSSIQLIKGVIFDLDDTLYSEKQYIRSGYGEVADFLGREDADKKLWAYFENGKNAIDEYLSEIGEEEKKTACLRIYREHMPKIHLYDGVAMLIEELKNKGIKIGIITDGRPEGQKNKMMALGLFDLVNDIIITDELGGVQFRKPCDIAFRIIQNRWRMNFEQIMYVGDNLRKDFQACKQLGMQWLYFKNDDGIYCDDQNLDNVSVINSILDVREYV